MIIIFQVIFWIAVFSVFWIFIGYPILLYLITRTTGEKNTLTSTKIPKVTMIVPTFNEASVIEKKLQNITELDYPQDKLEVILVDSASTDNTLEIVKRTFPQVRIVPLNYKPGKARAINFVLPLTNGEIIIVTDANAFMNPDVVRKLVPLFSDIRIGAATGAMRQLDRSGGAVAEGGGLYWKLEMFMRTREARLHSVIAMSGEVSAFRRALFVKQDQTVVDWYAGGGTDDFEMTLWVIRNGYRVAYAPDARVWEYAPDNTSDLFKQKVRIIVQTIVTVRRNLNIVLKSGVYGAIIFPSRKILPLFTPLFLIYAFVLNAFFVGLAPFWTTFFYAQVVVYALALFGLTILKHLRIPKFIAFFVLLNATVFVAWLHYLQGRDYTHWQPIASSRKL